MILNIQILLSNLVLQVHYPVLKLFSQLLLVLQLLAEVSGVILIFLDVILQLIDFLVQGLKRSVILLDPRLRLIEQVFFVVELHQQLHINNKEKDTLSDYLDC